MRRSFFIAMLLSAATAGGLRAWQESSVPALDGEWEGVIESARRPMVLAANFVSRTARLDAAGSAALKIENLTSEARRLRFQIPVGNQVLHFEGELRDAEIAGTIRVDQQPAVAFRLVRLPALPAPRDRIEAWQQDFDAVLTRFLQYDRSFSAAARETFRRRIADLRNSLPAKSDPEIIVALARAVALSGNAHTRLYLMRNRTEVRRLPIRVWWFKDELRIVRAGKEHAELLGCRIVKIGTIDTATATARVRGIKAGNDSWQRYMSAYFLTSPDVLFGAGVIATPENVALTVSCTNGSHTITLTPLPLRKAIAPVEAWWDLAPSYRDPNVDFVTALRSEAAPRYLQKPQENYWFEFIPELGAVYVQYNRSQEMSGGPSMKDFTATVLNAFETQKPRALIFDLRFNTGGNLEVGTPLVKSLAERSREVPIFVLTGRATFSAGITHVAQWKEWGRPIIVGEPVGDELDMWSEGGNLTLPNSKLTVHYANGFHSYSKREYPERRPYLMDLDVDSVAPDIAVEPSWDDYIRGKDPALEAVAKRLAIRSQ